MRTVHISACNTCLSYSAVKLQCHLMVIFDWQTCPGVLSLHGTEPWTHAVTLWQIMRLFIERGGRKACDNNFKLTTDWKYLNFQATLSLSETKSKWHNKPCVWCGDSRCCQLLLDARSMTWKVHYKNIQSKQWGFTKNDNGTINCSNTGLGLDFKMKYKLLSFLVQKWSSTGAALNARWPLIRFGHIPSHGLNSNIFLFNIYTHAYWTTTMINLLTAERTEQWHNS